jgi:lipopolysaccharide transport system ATP-binding protein
MSSEAKMGPAIRLHEISKRYQIGMAGEDWYRTLRDTIAGAVAAPIRWVRARRGRGAARSRTPSFIWALKDVSLNIEQGEIVGIIGRNGAGKTTLLKILSRITEPTGGWAEIRGRVCSLLEVGTGFHPELTGRENIYLNGAILGMRRAEIDRRFDEIVAFSEIEDFLDAPVKRYSSGMYVRLAFSVAAHLETEVLMVDEVLAVGDLAFQRKCLGKMGEAAGTGRTVLFVSHNMAVIQALCSRGVYLEEGKVSVTGSIDEAVTAYLGSLEEAVATDLSARTDRRGRQEVRLTSVEVVGDAGRTALVAGQPASFRFRLAGGAPQTSCRFTIYNHLGHPVATLDSGIYAPGDARGAATDGEWECRMEELFLIPGRYRLDVMVRGDNHVQDHVEAAAVFTVNQGVVRGRPVAGDTGHGDLALPHSWIVPGI